MKVKLVSYSQAPKGSNFNKLDVQELIAYAARVSNPSNQMNTETSERLIKYLIKHKHWSPFEMASACLEITTTRDIARQILRHRSFSFQEFSQRYADPIAEKMNMVIREARLQDTKNRQNSLPTNNQLIQDSWITEQQKVIRTCMSAYNWALQHGIAKEQARAVLPEGIVESRLYMNGTIRSWIHYIELRSANGTQKEHQEIAKECAKVLATILPMVTNYATDE